MAQPKRMTQFVRQGGATTSISWQVKTEAPLRQYDAENLRPEHAAGDPTEVMDQEDIPSSMQQLPARDKRGQRNASARRTDAALR